MSHEAMQSDSEIAEYWYTELIEGLRLIASSFEIQEKALPDFVHLPDEILNALPVDSFEFILEQGLISESQFSDIKTFDGSLDLIELPSDYEDMLKVMRSGQQFSESRVLALELLGKLGQKYKEPVLGAVYIKNS